MAHLHWPGRAPCSNMTVWAVKSWLHMPRRLPAWRAARLLLLLLVAVTAALLLVYSWLCSISPTEEVLLHAAAFQRHYGWLRTRSLREFVFPEHNTSLLLPLCATTAASAAVAAAAPLLAAVVTSAPSHAAARLAIRRSWGRPREELRTVFLVGLPRDEATQAALAAESAEYGDILQEPFVEHYQNLTVKSVFMLKWLSAGRCGPAAPFAFKVDDDIWVDMPALLAFVRRCARPDGACADDAPLVAGRLYSAVTAYRDTESKYYLPPRLYADDQLPDFVSGTAYVLSRSAAERLYTQALDTPFVNLEDLYVTGLVARRAGVRLLHAEGFRKDHPLLVHPCTCRGYVTVHGLTAEQLEWMEAASGDGCSWLWAVVNLVMPWVL